MLYFGIPVTCKEAFRIFDLDIEKTKIDLIEKYNLNSSSYMDFYFVDYLNIFFENEKMSIKIFYLDKGQCIFGYEMRDVDNFEKKFIDVDQFLIKLTKLKTLFNLDTIKFNKNFSSIELEHMEDEPEFVKFPQPYIIEYNK